MNASNLSHTPWSLLGLSSLSKAKACFNGALRLVFKPLDMCMVLMTCSRFSIVGHGIFTTGLPAKLPELMNVLPQLLFIVPELLSPPGPPMLMVPELLIVPEVAIKPLGLTDVPELLIVPELWIPPGLSMVALG